MAVSLAVSTHTRTWQTNTHQYSQSAHDGICRAYA